MANDPEITKLKYKGIRTDYLKWSSKLYKGVRMYTDSFIFKKLEEKYFTKASTIDNIVYHRTKY